MDKLSRIADALEDEFALHLQDAVETVEDGETTIGPPLLCIIERGALTPDEVKELDGRFRALAEEEGLEYEGVACFDPMDLEELFGWLNLEEATWRLQNYTESGLEEGAEIPWAFGLEVEEPEEIMAIAAAFE